MNNRVNEIIELLKSIKFMCQWILGLYVASFIIGFIAGLAGQ